MTKQQNVVINHGLADWQILQQTKGYGEVRLSGRWNAEKDDVDPAVWVRVVREDSAAAAAPSLDWHPAIAKTDGSWSIHLSRIPAGGLYRVETQLRTKGLQCPEWSRCGDVRHFVGVGDLWIIAGQSNSAGYGKGEIHDPPEPGIHLFNNAMQWTMAAHPLNNSTGSVHPANMETANSGHSPWLRWASIVKQSVGYPIGLLQCSLGGSALKASNPSEPGDHPLFDIMRDTVKAVGGRVRGVLWYQGCSDTQPGSSSTYLKRFCGAVAAWRKILKNPDLAVITVQLNVYTDPAVAVSAESWTAVREAQRLAAHRIRNVAVIPSFGSTLSDAIHNSPSGNLLIAQRCAGAALGMVYGRPVDWRAPEPGNVTIDASRRHITLTFQNVTGRLRPSVSPAAPFMVQDAEGEVPLTRAEYSGGPTIRLVLSRPAGRRVTVHCSHGPNPPPGPVDMTRGMPILAFSVRVRE